MKKTGRGTAGGPSREKNSIRPGKKNVPAEPELFCAENFPHPGRCDEYAGERKEGNEEGLPLR